MMALMFFNGRNLTAAGALLALPYLALAQADSTAQQALNILKQNCLSCHGVAQQMSGYDLRTRESALRGGTKGVAVVPGKADESALMGRLMGTLQPAMPLGGKLKDG